MNPKEITARSVRFDNGFFYLSLKKLNFQFEFCDPFFISSKIMIKILRKFILVTKNYFCNIMLKMISFISEKF